ncbi:MAG: thiol oxidoreductase, partial [Leptospiraceae bacterium]|nr:thiol oxidoreductase [Leptospiraceae bacterium]
MEQYSGGDTTVFDTTDNAFDLRAQNLQDIPKIIDFQDGNANFNRIWVPAGNSTVSGLGPTFNNSSCQGCHLKDGRGRPPSDGTSLLSMLIRISKKNQKDPITDSVVGLEHFGTQLNTKGIVEFGTNIQIPHEGIVTITYQEIPGIFPDGETYSLRQPTYTITWNVDGYSGTDPLKIHVPSPTHYDISPRVATMIPGLGLLEAIAEETLDYFAQKLPKKNPTVQGKKNIVWDFANNKKVVGRFGWKANQANLRQQNAGAFLGDMGLTTSIFPTENCPTGQTLCANSPSAGSPEISDSRLDRVTFYTSTV